MLQVYVEYLGFLIIGDYLGVSDMLVVVGYVLFNLCVRLCVINKLQLLILFMKECNFILFLLYNNYCNLICN